MYCAGRERAAQPGAPALPAAGAVRGGGATREIALLFLEPAGCAHVQ